MKKTIAVILAIIVLIMGPTPVYGVENKLVIDNKNVYEGMNKSYSKGYSPIVRDGKATIVLPLIYEGTGKIATNRIRVTPDLGSPGDSPFIYSNYRMDVSGKDNLIGGGKTTISGFLLRLDIPLAKDRINGSYPLIINTSFSIEPDKTQNSQNTIADESNGTNDDSQTIEQSFTIYVTITDGKVANASEPVAEQEPEPSPQPKIILEEYEIKPSVIMAGEKFDISLKLRNTEKKQSTSNIKVTCKGETEYILMDGNTNSFFINKISGGASHYITLHMKTRQDIESKPQRILVAIEYEDSSSTSYSVSEEILVEIRQPLRIETDDINIPATVNAGDSLPITTNIFNMGRSTLYNVRCVIEMPGVIPDGSAYLGNMEPGSSANAEIYAFFGTLDMGGGTSKEEDSIVHTSSANESGKYGRSEGTMTITYEDEYGEEHVKTLELATNIEKPIFDNTKDGVEGPEEKPERASQWWVSIIFAMGIIMILFGRISYKRKMEKLEREYGHEDL